MMDTSLWINAGAAIGQFLAAFLALVALVISVRTARAQQILSERLAREHAQLLFEQVRMQRDSDILQWTQDCVRLLSRAESLFETYDPADISPDAREDLRDVRHRLSALIDYGRLFFPNSNPDKKGFDNPAAYQGFRQRILTRLVSVYGIVGKFEKYKSAEQRRERLARLNDLRRQFVSEAQLAIDPRRYIALKEMNEIRVKQGLEIQKRENHDPTEE